MLINFSKLKDGDIFYYKSDKLKKISFRYINSGLRTLPANAVYMSGSFNGDVVFFRHDVMVIKEDKL